MNIDEVLKTMSLNEDVKDNISRAFNEAVELRATEIAASEIDDTKTNLEETFKQKVEDIEQSYRDKFMVVEQDLAESKQQVREEFESKLYEAYEEMKNFQENLVESIDSYIETAVNEYVDEVREKLEEAIEHKRSELTLSTFSSALSAAGVDILSLANKAKGAVNESSERAETRYQKAVEELNETKKQLNMAIKLGIINELKADMSLVESDKFEKVASLIPFERSEEYYNKLVELKNSFKSRDASFTDTPRVTESFKTTSSLNEGSKRNDDFSARLARLI